MLNSLVGVSYGTPLSLSSSSKGLTRVIISEDSGCSSFGYRLRCGRQNYRECRRPATLESLEEMGIRVWTRGYVFAVRRNRLNK